MTDEVIGHLQDGDIQAAVQEILRQGTTRDAARSFDTLVREVYWKNKDVRAVVAIARAGIQHCLTEMEASEEEADRSFFGDHAKRLAYNLASFTWPGWDEPEIALSAGDIAAGLGAAGLNLRLAWLLHKPADRTEDAHWLLGAHLLAAHEPAAALEEFELCSPQTRPLYAGYALLARVLTGATTAQEQFDTLLGQMRDGPDEQKANAVQLATAYRVFVH